MSDRLTHNYQEYLLDSLKDPQHAIEYLNAALEDADEEGFHLAVQNVRLALGLPATNAKRRRLSEFSQLWSLLKSLKLRLSQAA
jgi:DNA-binding phage protein